jgi:regulator of sirC expression with transglutaminase-like and TPR domain
MDLDQALDRLAKEEDAALDVAELALGLARDEYANLDADAYLSELRGMAHEARKYLRGTLEAQVTGLCRYLFHEMGFRGNTLNYYDPQNSYLNQVLDRRTGIPITLSVIAMAVGRRAGLEVVGVGLPGHFVVKALAGGREVLFDPFHGGRQLTPTDCERLVYQVAGTSIEATPETLAAVPLRALLTRLLSNLKAVYLKDRDFRRAVQVIERLCQLHPQDPTERRDLGICLFQAGKLGRSVDYLSEYLAAAPQGQEADLVRDFLNRALAELGRWN